MDYEEVLFAQVIDALKNKGGDVPYAQYSPSQGRYRIEYQTAGAFFGDFLVMTDEKILDAFHELMRDPAAEKLCCLIADAYVRANAAEVGEVLDREAKE